jgi:hypothetical protein
VSAAGLLLTLTIGYLTGATLFAGSRRSFLEPQSSRSGPAGWTVLTPSVTTSVADPRAVNSPAIASPKAR